MKQKKYVVIDYFSGKKKTTKKFDTFREAMYWHMEDSKTKPINNMSLIREISV